MWGIRTFVAALLTLGPHAVLADGYRPWDVAGLWPRDAALGHASTAAPGSASSVYFNPALLVDAKPNVIEYAHAPWELEPSGYGLAYAQSVGRVGTFGLAWSSYRAAAGVASDQALLSFSHAFEALGVGAGLRSKEKRSASGGSGLLASADLGLRQAYGGIRWGLSVVGLALNNPSVADPLLYSVGGAVETRFGCLLMDAKLVDGNLSLHAGDELPVSERLTLRFGLSPWAYQSASLGLSGGFGLNWGDDLRLDYGVAPGPGAVVQHSLSLSFSPSWSGLKLHQTRKRPPSHRAQVARRPDTEGTDGFPLQAEQKGREVTLSWEAPGSEDQEAWNYEVQMSLLPHAKFQSMPAPLPGQARWTGTLGLAGVTYYFRVRCLLPDGSVGPVSNTLELRTP